MTVADTDIKRYRPEVSDDTVNNGGRMTAVLSPGGLVNEVWPHVPLAERTAGSDKYRKRAYKIENADNLPFPNARPFLLKPTPGDDMVFIFPGTHTDTQGDLTGSEDLFGAGVLDENVSAGATEVKVLVEDWANYPIFRNGDVVAIHTGGSSYEFATINGAPSASVNVITLTLAAGLASGYTAGAAWVCSVIDHGTLQATVDTPVITSATGDLDESLIVPNHQGAIEQVLTLDFSGPTTFTAASDVAGSLGGGSTTSDWAPTNTDFGVEYLTIPIAAWLGTTFSNGDSVVLTLHPAAINIWERRIVPAGATTIASQTRVIRIPGESA